MARNSSKQSRRPDKKKKEEQKGWKVTVSKNNDYDLNEMKAWIDVFGKGKINFRHFKRQTTFYFSDADDAFKFKMRWEKA